MPVGAGKTDFVRPSQFDSEDRQARYCHKLSSWSEPLSQVFLKLRQTNGEVYRPLKEKLRLNSVS